MFLLKYPSLRQFDKKPRSGEADPTIVHNLKTLFGVEKTPSDTGMRERLDLIAPGHLRDSYRTVHRSLQRGKALEGFTVLGGHFLLSMDGTGYHSSSQVHCPSCCRKTHRDGRATYQHQMFAGALVHPDRKAVFSFAPEMIQIQDGETKNDCERLAAKRFVTAFRREHPHLKTLMVEDALAFNGPHIKHLKAHRLHSILGAKAVDLKVNVLHDTETQPGERPRNWSWVTDLSLHEENLHDVRRAARARWRIEHQTFKTLKIDGNHFEHNFGNGNHHLANVMVSLCLLAFLIDQVVEYCCGMCRQARKKQELKRYLRDAMMVLFRTLLINRWEAFY